MKRFVFAVMLASLMFLAPAASNAQTYTDCTNGSGCGREFVFP